MKNYMNSNFNRFDKQIAFGAYCQPECEYTADGKYYPDKNTAEQFDRMKELGVNLVFGHNPDAKNCHESVFRAMELCAERDIVYLINLDVFKEYLNVKRGKRYCDLSAAERDDLKQRFLAEIKKYDGYESFGGLFFCDEPGAESFEGIAAAKKIFLNAYPEKLFYVNMFQYFITPEMYQFGGAAEAGAEISERYKNPAKEENYLNFAKDYIAAVNPQVYSYDLYPMVTLHGECTNVHRGFYELPFIVREYIAKIGAKTPFWNFLQCGGRWEGSLATRVPNANECALLAHGSIAMGARGIEVFPYCFPDCWTTDKDVEAGIIDADGNLTERFYFYKRAFDQIKAAEKYITEGEYYGVNLTGEFKGLMPSKEEIAEKPDSECFFVGEFNCNSFTKDLKPIKEIITTSQLLTGCYELAEGKRLFYVVNNSVTDSANVQLNLDRRTEAVIIRGAKKTELTTEKIELPFLTAGEGVAVILQLGNI